MQEQLKVGIVLVNFNGEKFQNDCLRAIYQSTYQNYEVIVVDNGSHDESIRLTREEFPEAIIIETGENCGVAKGNNIGIKKALEDRCEYVLLLNNDTEVAPDMLYEMLKSADNTTMVTCKMYYYSQSDVIWCAGGKFNWRQATTSHFGENQRDAGQYDQSMVVDYSPTCCMLIHCSVFEKVGFMDEAYFMYYDDTDFVYRASKEGIRLWYQSSAKLWHKVSSSSGGSQSTINLYYGNRNRLYFIHKQCKNKAFPLLYFYLTRAIRLLTYRFKDRKRYHAIASGIHDYYAKHMGIWQA